MAKGTRNTAKAKPAAVKQSAQPAQPAQQPAKKNKMMAIGLAVFVLFIAVEIFVVFRQNAMQSKKPVYVNAFPAEHKGLTSLGEYGDYLYGVDNTRGDVYRFNKQDGKLVKLLEYAEGVYSALQDADGRIFVLLKNNTVVEVDPATYKTKKIIPMTGVTSASWLELDSKGNFFVVDGATAKIYKFDHDFNKLAQFGGRGPGKDQFTNAGKLFAGPKDDIYVINEPKLNSGEIKVFDNDGKFKKMWAVNGIKKFTYLSNLAITPDGSMYINAFEDNKVCSYDKNGKYLGSFDTDAEKRFLITYPASIAGGKNGLFYVVTHHTGVFENIKY